MPPIDWEGMWRPERSPWETIARAAIVYLYAHVVFRVVGRRELGQHTTYTIVLLFFVGVVFRMTIVGSDPSLTTGMIGFATLAGIDALARWLSNRSPRVARLINGPVRVLVRDGRVDERQMRRAHVSREHLLASLRMHGHERIEDIRLASLERSGAISFVFASPPTH
jgi:uncharacterized membrane protein YcaP (DUF421 family)